MFKLEGCKNTKILRFSKDSLDFRVQTECMDKVLIIDISMYSGFYARLASPSAESLGKCTLMQVEDSREFEVRFDTIPGKYFIKGSSLFLSAEDFNHEQKDGNTVWTFNFGEDTITLTAHSNCRTDQDKYTYTTEQGNAVTTTSQFFKKEE